MQESSLTTKKISVGALRHYFLPPSETFIYNSIRSLTRYETKVFAIARRSEDKFPLPGVTALRSLPFGTLEALLYRATMYSPRFIKWAKTVSILHAHMGYTGVHGLVAAKRLGIPLMTSFYGKDVTILKTREKYKASYWHFWAFAKKLFAQGDRFLVLSGDMKEKLADCGCPEEKIVINPLGIDLSRFSSERTARAPGAPTELLMVGREVQKKGFDDGLRACAQANAQGADLKVTLLGTDGPMRSELMQLAESLSLEVSWPEPSTSVPTAMAAADVLLVPSRTADDGDREGTPTVICEGSSAALPIVATRHAGIPEQVDDGTTGLLSDERDVKGLAASLLELSQNPAKRLEMGVAARKKAESDFSISSHRDRLQDIYDSLL